MDNKEVYDIYIEVDAILDTRLALLHAISEDAAVVTITNGTYNKRIRDNFRTISSNVFKSLYSRRNKVLLKYALPTNIFKIVNELLIGHITDSVTIKQTKLYINVYPYILTDVEKNVILGVVEGLIKNCVFELVYMDPIKDLTPIWVRDNVQAIIKYDGLLWLENHNKLFNLTNTPLMDKTIIVPALIAGPSSKAYKIDSKFFITVAATMKSLIKVQFVDILYFNGLIKK